MNNVIYLDYNATTPMDERVFEKMAPFFCESFGNAASSGHCYGQEAAKAVFKAREQVANLIGATPEEIIFTSGATEANNLAIKGVPSQYEAKGNHIITVNTEHIAVLDSCAVLEGRGKRITYLEVDKFGLIKAENIADAIGHDTVLVSVMTVNNETGVVQPIAEIGEICREKGVLFHTDAVQAAGKIPFNVQAMKVDLASLTAHKFYGPKGVGALYMRHDRAGARAQPIIHGGGHEKGMRSGTLNVPGIVGFGAAAELISAELDEEMRRIENLRQLFEKQLVSQLSGLKLNGHPEARVPGTLNLSFEGCDGNALLTAFTEVAVSAGAACNAAHVKPSHVLSAMGVTPLNAARTLRFSLGRFTTAEEIHTAVAHVTEVVNKVRATT